MTSPPSGRSESQLALVLSGGGARAAYQVGLLRALASRRPDLEVPILTGVSAGAINAAFLAAHPGSFRDSVEALTAFWTRLDVSAVFRTDTPSLAGNLLRWGFRLVSGGGRLAPEVRGLVDPTPLRRLLEQSLEAAPDGTIPGLARAMERRRLHSFTVTTSNYSTGQSVAWAMGRAVESWERPDRRSVPAPVTVDHVMASSALPLFFPAVPLDGSWHGDGGIRQTAPLSPAIHLGADRILAISTRYRRTVTEADRPAVRGYPPPLQILGQLLNAIFLDMLDQDCLRVERLNALVCHLPEAKRRGLRPLEVTAVRPSVDLGALAAEVEPELPWLFRHLVRSLGSRQTASPDLLSLVLFQADYCRRLIEIGEADAEERMAEIAPLLDA
ncbi:MAG: patatin-like phospholipase family protein [Thermoanaerobaculia bacterium]